MMGAYSVDANYGLEICDNLVGIVSQNKMAIVTPQLGVEQVVHLGGDLARINPTMVWMQESLVSGMI